MNYKLLKTLLKFIQLISIDDVSFRFKQDVKIVHFIGATKPWHHTYSTSSGEVVPLLETGHNKDFLQIWWDLFMRFVQPSLDPSLVRARGT